MAKEENQKRPLEDAGSPKPQQNLKEEKPITLKETGEIRGRVLKLLKEPGQNEYPADMDIDFLPPKKWLEMEQKLLKKKAAPAMKEAVPAMKLINEVGELLEKLEKNPLAQKRLLIKTEEINWNTASQEHQKLASNQTVQDFADGLSKILLENEGVKSIKNITDQQVQTLSPIVIESLKLLAIFIKSALKKKENSPSRTTPPPLPKNTQS
ncbi:hypothetical protein KJ632_05015 [Patescibacteria group bacterium]|nr:hypothetical protein [Patescibacteria group bacterium]